MNNAYYDPRIRRGMETQFKLRQDRLYSGEKPIGWKVGFGAPAALERLRIDAPLIGFLTDRTLLHSGEIISVASWSKPALEPEIAVYMGKDLPGKLDRRATRDAIASIGPALELADLDFPPDDVEMILAGNIYNRHVILGRADPSRAGGMLDGLVGHVYRNANETATIKDLQALTGDIIDVVSHVANLLSALGERLRAGEVVITGSIIPPIWIESTDEIQYDLQPIDLISVNIHA
ncbi:MAG TPA: fumarylacetoacetate hydrolase family protein [Anaerolineales bacterium]|nr:fumarylacetoacetate hydrolase family protein [Anaerolineales bacterium]